MFLYQFFKKNSNFRNVKKKQKSTCKMSKKVFARLNYTTTLSDDVKKFFFQMGLT